MRSRVLALAMVIAVVCVAAIALWDDGREAAAALRALARERTVLAGVVAHGLVEAVERAEVDPAPQDGARHLPALPVSFVDPDGRRHTLHLSLDRLVPAGPPLAPNTIVLLRPPGASHFQRVDGLPANLDQTLDVRGPSVTLTHDEAASLGLPPRMAIAGLARVRAGSTGEWTVAVIESAQDERDRQRRARWRLALCVLFATGLVVGFGGLALRARRHEGDLQRTLRMRDLERQRDAELARQERATTMITLAAGVAHEVSTPLSVIAGRAEQLVAKLGDDERSRRAAQAIVEQSARIHEVVRGFLRVARGDAAMFERLSPLDLARTAAARVEHRFTKAGVSLHTDVGATVPALRGDASLLEQVLVNLLLNACDACKTEGHVTLSVSSDATHVTFTVRDDGAGISEADAARVFEPFFSTKPSDKGTGLGLAISTEIVKIHRGTLTLESSPPRGTLARVRLPIEQEM